MTVLVMLFASLLLFSGLGALEVWTPLSTWQEFVAWALAVIFLFTASDQFTRTKKEYLINMVPKAFPKPRLLVRLTEVLEVLRAVGLLIPATGSLAGLVGLSQAACTVQRKSSHRYMKKEVHHGSRS